MRTRSRGSSCWLTSERANEIEYVKVGGVHDSMERDCDIENRVESCVECDLSGIAHVHVGVSMQITGVFNVITLTYIVNARDAMELSRDGLPKRAPYSSVME